MIRHFALSPICTRRTKRILWHTAFFLGVTAVLAIYATPVWAQDESSPRSAPQIRGTVLEAGADHPVMDAEVSLYYLGAERPQLRISLGSMKRAMKTTSDAGGHFEFSPNMLGYYAVAVRKEGYNGTNSSLEIALTSSDPTSEVRLSLVRPGWIAGHVLDEDTGKPVAGLRLRAWDAQMLSMITKGRATFYGSPTFGAGSEAVTDADGAFAIPQIKPGSYVVEVCPKAKSGARILRKFSEDDLSKIESDYQQTYWPGGAGADSALPVSLVSGSGVDIGRIAVRKCPYYRVHVRLPGSTCTPSEKLMVYEEASGYQLPISDDTPCEDMLITGFPAGASRLILATRGSNESRLMASVPLAITDENIELILPLARGLTLEGTLIAATNATITDFSNIRVTLQATGMIPFVDLQLPAKPDAAGTFRFTGVPAADHKLTVTGLRADEYVKDIHYNDIHTDGLVVPIRTGAPNQSLAIVVDDKAATITGTVKDGDNLVDRPYVLLALANGFSKPIAMINGDRKGAFQLTSIAPGEYRILAVPSFEEYLYRTFGVLERALVGAERIELGPREFRNLTLRLTPLR